MISFRTSSSSQQAPSAEQAYYQGLITDENVGLFVAEVNRNAVGFVHGIMRDTPAIPILVSRWYAIVDSIGVKSDFHDGGIGRMLIQRIRSWAIAKDATEIELNVHAFNTGAISFYRKLGYEAVSQRMSQSLD